MKGGRPEGGSRGPKTRKRSREEEGEEGMLKLMIEGNVWRQKIWWMLKQNCNYVGFVCGSATKVVIFSNCKTSVPNSVFYEIILEHEPKLVEVDHGKIEESIMVVAFKSDEEHGCLAKLEFAKHIFITRDRSHFVTIEGDDKLILKKKTLGLYGNHCSYRPIPSPATEFLSKFKTIVQIRARDFLSFWNKFKGKCGIATISVNSAELVIESQEEKFKNELKKLKGALLKEWEVPLISKFDLGLSSMMGGIAKSSKHVTIGFEQSGDLVFEFKGKENIKILFSMDSELSDSDSESESDWMNEYSE